jgi:hypothetical protein
MGDKILLQKLIKAQDAIKKFDIFHKCTCVGDYFHLENEILGTRETLEIEWREAYDNWYKTI